MPENVVVTTAYVVTYGLILWYGARLHLRYRRLTRRH